MIINATPRRQSHATLGWLPDVWIGDDTLDGTADPWKSAALGAEYIYRTGSTVRAYRKLADTDATADWVPTWSNLNSTKLINIPLGDLYKVSSNNLVSTVGTNKRVKYLPLPLSMWREVASNDIPNTAAIGGILTTDSTPAYEYVNGDTDSQHRLRWASSNSDAITTSIPIPDDMDRTQDVTLYIRGESAGTTNVTTTFTVETFWDEGDTKVSDTSAAMAAAVGNRAATIAAADIPDTAETVSIELTLGAHTTDAIDVYAIWLEYYELQNPYLQAANGDTDAAANLTWVASDATPVWWSGKLPNDVDGSKDVTVYFRAKSGGSTDTPTFTVDTWWDEGDTKVSDTSSALGSSFAEESATVAAADIPDSPELLTLKLTPGSHTTDTAVLSGLWIEYVPK